MALAGGNLDLFCFYNSGRNNQLRRRDLASPGEEETVEMGKSPSKKMALEVLLAMEAKTHVVKLTLGRWKGLCSLSVEEVRQAA